MKVYKTLEDGIRIVEYEDSLAQALVEMWQQSGDSWGGDSEIRTADQIIAEHAAGSFFNVFVAMKDGEAVCYCSFGRYYKDTNTAYVPLLNVRPDFHGKKIGKELVLLCVNKTIEMGYPRVDINTWPGNTRAVPLYKKCGFLWEDRADSTHLQNQIPTVLSTELFADFFNTADWYADSTRVIEIKPDGQKQNGFEIFEYSWAKDGRSLRVGFERTGRRIRLVETDDYMVELTAENHELAFGLSYKCAFRVENKSGAPLHIVIDGKSDGTISFDYHADATITGVKEFDAEFAVGEIAEEQDIWRVHPCVLADVTVNGKRAQFGLGIEPRFPLAVSLVEKRFIPRLGTTQAAYINIESALPDSARVTFAMPENPLLRFHENSFEVEVGRRQKACAATKAEITGFGYASLPIEYDIALADGRRMRFTKPLHIVNQGAGAAFAYETASEYGAANGLWKLAFNKENNNMAFGRALGAARGRFIIGKLGKPYDDEFNLMKPAATRLSVRDGLVTFEADFASQKFAGAVLTETYAFDAAGTLEQRHRVTNTSAREQALFLKADVCVDGMSRPAFHYDGTIHGVGDDLAYGFSNIYDEKLDENWIFNADAKNPIGVYWPAGAKPVPHWGDSLMFEYETGALLPGQSFETEPVVLMSGVFDNPNDFRNYVLGIYETDAPYMRNHLEIEANGFNPVIAQPSLDIKALNHRPRTLEGELALQSEDGVFAPAARKTPVGRTWDQIAFPISLAPAFAGVTVAALSMRFAGFEKIEKRALLVAGGKPVAVEERGGVLAAVNGPLSFCASSDYCGALHSLAYEGREWLFSPYPVLKPYAWWNPFIGGMTTWLPNMNAALALRERCTARPVQERDCFGNAWTGIVTTLAVEQLDEHRGLSYEQYYLTLPGVPALCYFVRLTNESGAYKSLALRTEAFLSGKQGLSSVYAAYTDDEHTSYRLRAGKEDFSQRADKLITVSREGEDARPERMYIFREARRGGGDNYLHADVNSFSFGTDSRVCVAHGESYAVRPSFFILSQKELTQEALGDLGRVRFSPCP